MPRRFHTLDVFTRTPLAGNPLAVVLDADGLDDARMQAIAAEFNLSETVFVGPPADASHQASVRIFTPGREVPFAGHPTVGTAVLLASLEGEGAREIAIETRAGPVRAEVTVEGAGVGRARFATPGLPEELGEPPETRELARALGLTIGEIGLGLHLPTYLSAGVPMIFVPLACLDAVVEARIVDADVFADPGAVFVYSAETVEFHHDYHARMFAPGFGITEDPATGSAVAAFGEIMRRFERPGDGHHAYTIEQGYEMGRPSLIGLEVEIKDDALQTVWLSGEAVPVSRGEIDI